MAHQLLHGSDVGAALKQVCRERMPQRVRRHPLARAALRLRRSCSGGGEGRRGLRSVYVEKRRRIEVQVLRGAIGISPALPELPCGVKNRTHSRAPIGCIEDRPGGRRRRLTLLPRCFVNFDYTIHSCLNRRKCYHS
jgi:hypothetical protein